MEVKQWLGILGGLLALSLLGCSQQTSFRCGDKVALSDGVTMEKCWDVGWWESTLIKIDKLRANSELWVLEELNGRHTAIPRTPTGVAFDGKLLNNDAIQRRSQAVVQINGYSFSCDPENPSSDDDKCYKGGFSYPTTTVYESTKRLSDFELTPDPVTGISGQYMLTSKPRDLGPLLEVSAEGVVPPNETDHAYYNAFGNSWPHLLDLDRDGLVDEGECIHGPNLWPPIDWTLLGVSDDHIIMLYLGGMNLNDETCAALISQPVGAHTVFQMDGSDSAGLFMGNGQSAGHVDDRHIPYRIGLVTLEEQNRVMNGDFETPDLSRRPSGTPPGFHSYSGMAIQRDLQWDGAMFLYNTPLYHEWVRAHRQSQKEPIPSRGAQIAAIRTRGDDTNHISQDLRGIPDDRYCMLHFYHGYHKPDGCNEDDSKLTVTAGRCDGSLPDTTAEYTSGTTHGWDPQLLLANEVWLRLLTPSDGACMRLTFTASQKNPGVTSGNCEVLLDDVSVSCAL